MQTDIFEQNIPQDSSAHNNALTDFAAKRTCKHGENTDISGATFIPKSCDENFS